jgi:hypothetical protein
LLLRHVDVRPAYEWKEASRDTAGQEAAATGADSSSTMTVSTMQRLLSILQSANAETDFRFQTDRPLYAGELEINFPIRCLKRNSPTARQDLRVSLSVEGRRIFGEALDLYPSARTKCCTKTSPNG